MKLRKIARLVFLLTGVAMLAAPDFRANGATGDLKSFQAECSVTSTAITCSGNLIGNATLKVTSFNTGTVLGSAGSDFVVFLLAENFVLTTPDGSTLTFETSGTEVNSTTGNFRAQNSYLVTGGTGRFATATGGSGNYVVAGTLPGFPATIHLDGNIQF